MSCRSRLLICWYQMFVESGTVFCVNATVSPILQVNILRGHSALFFAYNSTCTLRHDRKTICFLIELDCKASPLLSTWNNLLKHGDNRALDLRWIRASQRHILLTFIFDFFISIAIWHIMHSEKALWRVWGLRHSFRKHAFSNFKLWKNILIL